MMVTDGGSKVYCFSEGEFSVLADACRLRRLLCFDTFRGEGSIEKLNRREYYRVVYDLGMRDILKPGENELTVIDPVAEMFGICRECIVVACFYNESEARYTACFYLDTDGRFTLILSGSKPDEYVRMSLHDEEEFDEIIRIYIEECDILRIYSGKGMDLLKECVIRTSNDEMADIENAVNILNDYRTKAGE